MLRGERSKTSSGHTSERRYEGLVPVRPARVCMRVTSAARDQRAVDEEGRAPGNGEGHRKRGPTVLGTALGIAFVADTLSITTMEIVDNAVLLLWPGRALPARRRGTSVSRYPKKKASATARAIDGRSSQPHQVARTIPSTSPIPQPVRQWFVAGLRVR